jgi:adhesin transport system membrane fusion protein
MMKADIPAVKPMGPPQDPALQGLAHALRRTRPGLASRGLLVGLCTVFAGLAVWAHFARVDDVARGDGRIVPSGRMQVVQHLEGGVVNAIHVKPGDEVDLGTPLLSLSPVQFGSERDSRSEQVLALKARQARLEAEARGSEPRFDASIKGPGAATYLRTERSEFEQRRARLDADLATVETQLTQRLKEVDEARTALATARRNLSLAREEREIVATMVERGLEPRLELVRLDGRISEIQGRVDSAQMMIPRLDAAVAEVRARRQTILRQFRADAASELSRTTSDLRAQQELLPGLSDRVERTEIVSPTKGIVNRVAVTTVGATARAGEPLVEIVPVDDKLVIDVRIRPQDIGFVKIGMPARIKLTAYDYSIFGTVEGEVISVSPDVVPGNSEQEPPAYQARIETRGPVPQRQGKPVSLLPGMQASVDIITGNKTVLDYISKPIVAMRENAFRER